MNKPFVFPRRFMQPLVAKIHTTRSARPGRFRAYIAHREPLLSACLLALLVCLALPAVLAHRSPDFAQDYAAAWGWRHGLDPNATTTTLLAACCPLLSAHVETAQTAHPPLATLLMVPLAQLPWLVARLVWLAVSATCIVAAWWLCRTPLRVRIATAVFVYIGLVDGTFEPLLLLLFAIVLRSLDTRPSLAAVVLGFATALKVYPALMIVALLLGRRSRQAVLAASAAALFTLGAEALIGFGSTIAWLQFVPLNTALFVDRAYNTSLVMSIRSVLPQANPTTVAAMLLVCLLLPLARTLQRDPLRPMFSLISLIRPLAWPHYLMHISLGALRGVDLALLLLSSGMLIGIGLGLVPAAGMAPLAYTPLLVVRLLQWYRAVLTGSRSPTASAGARAEQRHAEHNWPTAGAAR